MGEEQKFEEKESTLKQDDSITKLELPNLDKESLDEEIKSSRSR